ncbi:membrane hypothetical protein [Clostridiaceae bacterium BL-3]|nr:membrane hypothetical protein [Clostridiaceae bacterium BL-3]
MNIFKGQFQLQITLGFVLSTIFIVIFAVYACQWITKKSFELYYTKTKVLFVLGSVVMFSIIAMIKIFTEKYVLFSVNFLYPLVILCIILTFIVYLDNKHVKQIVKTYKKIVMKYNIYLYI